MVCLAEDDELLEQKHLSQTSLTTVRDDKLGLTQQQALLL